MIENPNYKKGLDVVVQYLIQKYEVEKVTFDINIFRFAIRNAFSIIYTQELTQIANELGLDAMESRVLELEDIEKKSSKKQLDLEMFRVLNSDNNKEIYKQYGQPEDIYVMFEHTSGHINSNCEALANELFYYKEAVKAD